MRLWTNKRATGMLNLKFHRKSKHKTFAVEAVIADICEQKVDHLLITGDVSNLSLETEFAAVEQMLSKLNLTDEQISLVPGNHDVYTRGAQRSQRFFKTFERYMHSDLPVVGADTAHPSGVFPFVKLRGDVAIVGLSSAVVRPPVVSAGWIGPAQLSALDTLLNREELRDRGLVVMMHHPLINPQNPWRRYSRGLAESAAMTTRMLSRDRAVFVHGHLHEAAHRTLGDGTGHETPHLGTSSASLLTDGGYNIYNIDASGLQSAEYRKFDGATKTFASEVLPTRDSNFAG